MEHIETKAGIGRDVDELLQAFEAFKDTKTALNMNVELPTLESIKEFVRMGSGVALVPRITVDDDLKRGELVEVPVNELRLERQMRIVSREGAPMSHAGKAFLKVCEQIASVPNGRYMFQQERKPRRPGARSAPA